MTVFFVFFCFCGTIWVSVFICVYFNDVFLNPGTEHEERRPYEVFINSKNMDQFQWVVALTRVISAVFRKGGVFMPSIVAKIGCAIESHLKHIGMLKNTELDEHQQKLIASKRKEYEAKQNSSNNSSTPTEDFPEAAQLCSKCNTKALVLMDGCMTCLSCGDSKCG